MNQSMLKQYNNKGIISFFSLFLLMFCSKEESNIKNSDISSVHSIKYVGGNEGVKLSEDKQKKAFGKWKLTNAVFFNDSKKLENKIIINKNIIVAEQSIFDTENNIIANKHNTIGTYKFKSLDTLNTVYYIFSVEDNKMMMQTSNLFRVVDGKMTKDRARINLFFVRE